MTRRTQARALRAAGWTLSQIAEVLEASENTVSRWLHR